MRNGAAEFLRGAFDIHMDPLMIARGFGKHIDAILINCVPIGHADFLASQGFEIVICNCAWVRHVFLQLEIFPVLACD